MIEEVITWASAPHPKIAIVLVQILKYTNRKAQWSTTMLKFGFFWVLAKAWKRIVSDRTFVTLSYHIFVMKGVRPDCSFSDTAHQTIKGFPWFVP